MYTFIITIIEFSLSLEAVSLCSLDWPPTHDPPASNFRKLGYQGNTTLPITKHSKWSERDQKDNMTIKKIRGYKIS